MHSATYNHIKECWKYGPLGEEYAEQRLKTSSLLFTTLVINLLSLALPILLLQIYDRIIPHKSYGTLAMLVSGVTIALIMEGLLRYCTAYITGWTGAAFEHKASLRALQQMSNADVQMLELEGTATYLQRIAAIMKLRECYSGRTLMAVIDLPFSLLYLFIVWYLADWLVVAPIIVVALFVVLAVRSSNLVRAQLDQHVDSSQEKYNFIIDVLNGIHTVKSLGMETQMMRRFEHLQAEVTRSAYTMGIQSSQNTLLMDIFSNAAMAVTVLFGSIFVMHGALSVGGLAACTLLVGRMMQPLSRALDSWSKFQDYLVAREHSQAILELPTRNTESVALPLPHGEIFLDDVSFYYATSADKPILQHISLHVQPGEAIAITGTKGSGKTTLLQLIMGTFAPVQGVVRIDGFDPVSQDPALLRGHLAYLPQKSVLFRGTVMENLTCFRGDPETKEAARLSAAELGISTMINSLPLGYNTYLGDSSADPIAPGVKQRLCLARALTQEAKILLFDDADRALDKEGYRHVLEALWRRKGTATLIIASEDEGLQAICDKIYSIGENGLISVPKRR